MDEGGSFMEIGKINIKSIDMAMYIITIIWWQINLFVTVSVPNYKYIDISRLGPFIIVIKNKWDWSGLATSELSSGGRGVKSWQRVRFCRKYWWRQVNKACRGLE
jgi:hypothetical protein